VSSEPEIGRGLRQPALVNHAPAGHGPSGFDPARGTGRIVCWFSCGAASAVAAKLVLSEGGNVVIAYCETGAEHPDNERFLADCERWFGQEVVRLKSPDFADTWAVWEKRRYLSGFNGAPCTGELKVAPRLDWQLPSDMNVWGYTADKLDAKRAARMVAEYPAMRQRSPLIERGLTKANVLAMIQGAGITLPPMYALGFHNNNCIPCVKATSPAYWALVRKHFPAHFDRMAKLSRELGARLTILGRKDGKNIRAFIDEIPADQATTNPISPACDFLCPVAEMERAA
jgi:3'-phosphoadenosine 5'-phosphosulfate sulfotransferase (PAPS reductase)/FAD synthetase